MGAASFRMERSFLPAPKFVRAMRPANAAGFVTNGFSVFEFERVLQPATF
jgi:hypothetical protein